MNSTTTAHKNTTHKRYFMELKFDQGRGYNFEARLELYANEI